MRLELRGSLSVASRLLRFPAFKLAGVPRIHPVRLLLLVHLLEAVQEEHCCRQRHKGYKSNNIL